MSQNQKKQVVENEQDAFEMIELAIDDLNLLTRAFDLVSDLCQETDDQLAERDSDPCSVIIH